MREKISSLNIPFYLLQLSVPNITFKYSFLLLRTRIINPLTKFPVNKILVGISQKLKFSEGIFYKTCAHKIF